MTARLSVKDIPELPRYISVAQAAEIFGLSKPGMYDKIYRQQAFAVVYRIGGGDDPGSDNGERPFLVLLKDEVLAVKRREAEPSQKATMSAWIRRVKQWGREADNGGFRVNASGPPSAQLVRAYLEANPGDVRPV